MMIRQDLHLHSDQNHVLIYSINRLFRKRTPNHLAKLV